MKINKYLIVKIQHLYLKELFLSDKVKILNKKHLKRIEDILPLQLKELKIVVLKTLHKENIIPSVTS
jgi:hypothetical protein